MALTLAPLIRLWKAFVGCFRSKRHKGLPAELLYEMCLFVGAAQCVKVCTQVSARLAILFRSHAIRVHKLAPPTDADEPRDIVQERKAMAREREQMANERQRMDNERQQMANERQRMANERQQMANERQQMDNERQQMANERQQMAREREKMYPLMQQALLPRTQVRCNFNKCNLCWRLPHSEVEMTDLTYYP